MRPSLALVAVAVAAAACDSSSRPVEPLPQKVLLKEMRVERLPSPYYVFGYDGDGKVTSASFASGLKNYRVDYDANRIADMTTTFFADNDSLQYGYDDQGRVALIKYLRAGAIRAVVFFDFSGDRLVHIERDVRVTGGFLLDKSVTLSYDIDGNLAQLIEHRPAIEGVQPEATTTDTFEDYDSGINVDDFALLHDDFFDELFLLPGVRLQHGNPRRVVRTGDGTNYVTQYTYAYDSLGRPVSKSAAVSGPLIDSSTFLTTYSYY